MRTLQGLVVQAVQLAANRPVRIVGRVHVHVETIGMRANLVDQRGIRRRAARRAWCGRRQRDDDRPVYTAVAAMDVSRGRGRDPACPERPADLRGRRLQPDQRMPDPVGICRRNLIPALHDRRLVLSTPAVVGTGNSGKHERAQEQPDDCGDNDEPVPHVSTSLDRSLV